MSSYRPLFAALFSMMVAAPFVVACSGGSDASDDQASAPTDDEIKAGGGIGAKCTESKKCKTGLTCKYDDASSDKSTAPPPGAMGMPVSSSSSGGPPPGAMGMPLLVGRCDEPDPGTEGGICNSSVKCHAGLHCDYLANASSSSGPHFPPGAMGMPIRQDGKCKKSGGPPPGTMGMPLHP
jgi:hypothetical protein